MPGYVGDYGPVDLYVENTSISGFGYGVDGYFKRAGGHVYADCANIHGYNGRVYDHDLGGYPPGIGELCK